MPMLYRAKHTNQNIIVVKQPKNRIIVFLGYLVICTLLITGVTFSSYLSTTSGAGSAAVAVFNFSAVKGQTQSDTVTLDCNSLTANTQSYTFSVTSQSEVALSYDVIVDFGSNNMQHGILVKLDDRVLSFNNERTVFTLENAGAFTAAGGTNTHTLTFTAPAGQAFFEQAISGASLKVVAEQVD